MCPWARMHCACDAYVRCACEWRACPLSAHVSERESMCVYESFPLLKIDVWGWVRDLPPYVHVPFSHVKMTAPSLTLDLKA